MPVSNHDFRLTIVIGKEIPHNWWLIRLLSNVKNKDASKINIAAGKKKDLLGCFKCYVSKLSNGDRILNTYFKEDGDYIEEVFDKMLEDLNSLGIGWVIYR